MYQNSVLELEIIYRDIQLVVINKPHGLLVHKSSFVGEAEAYAVQVLRKQLGQFVYPCHRIDRKTGGVLLFALNQEFNSLMQQQFAQNLVRKKYLAIVRGFTEDVGIIDYPLTNEKGKVQDAITEYKTLKRSEIEIPLGKFETSRYSLVEVYPQTGRFHQIRKHFAHIHHPIIGDRPHGCNKQNKLFKEKFGMTTMMLHALEITFRHPIENKEILIQASLQQEFSRTKEILNL
ncbi:pseudouridine synthase [Bacteroidota bacterium]